MTVTSTVPGAIGTVYGYLQTVAAQNPALDVGTYIGLVPGYAANNFMQIGEWETGALLGPGAKTSWETFPANAALRHEEYTILGTIRSWAGNVDPQGRIGDAFTLLNGLHAQVVADIGGSGTLTPSGSWGDLDWTVATSGVMGGEGWGVVLAWELHVINARLAG